MELGYRLVREFREAGERMSWFETLRSGLEAIRAHRLRSALTMLGIVIGISSVIVTVGLGLGAQDEVRKQIDALGSNLLVVSPGSSTSSSGVRGGFGSGTTLSSTDAAALADGEVAPDIAKVAPVVTSNATLLNGTTNWSSRVVGSTTDWPSVRKRTLTSGRFFTRSELDSDAKVVVLGPDTASELGAGVGQSITVSGQQMTVIGLLDSTGDSDDESSENDMVLMPITTAKLLSGSTSNSISTIYVEAKSQAVLSAAYQEINAALLTLHDVTTADFSISTQESLLETANATNKTLTVLLGGVAAISLLVGGIGVMNIMLVSVTERIREIGLRKALGATPRVIRRQFLVEAGALGTAGGAIGIVLGIGTALALPHFLDQPVSVSAAATLVALIVALLLGLGFGVYPAGRAAKLTPIDALRSE